MARVLIVDDDMAFGRMLSTLLIRRGHQAHHISDASGIVHHGMPLDADVVVTDIFMPGVEGIEIIRSLKAAPPHRAIIAISGGSSAMPGFDPLRAAKAIGADAVLLKPFEAETMLALIDGLVGARPMGD
jgi:CheY-like chemotaxis protein